jgi:hypothetical protein
MISGRNSGTSKTAGDLGRLQIFLGKAARVSHKFFQCVVLRAHGPDDFIHHLREVAGLGRDLLHVGLTCVWEAVGSWANSLKSVISVKLAPNSS